MSPGNFFALNAGKLIMIVSVLFIGLSTPSVVARGSSGEGGWRRMSFCDSRPNQSGGIGGTQAR